MEIKNNILKHYLRNCYFITGTAYAGKSTMCKMLAEKYGMIHCEENYNMDTILSVVNQEDQPNLNYFNTKIDWKEYVNRTADEFEKWFYSTSDEVTGFEIAELIKLSANGKVIIDTNIPCEVLKEITDYDHVAVMLAPQEMSVERFFDREDEEKQFLLSVIESCPDPEKSLANFKECISRVNSRKYYDKYQNSGFFTVVRSDTEADTREETLEMVAKHFGLDREEESVEVFKVGIFHAEWNKLIDYANNCSWIAGPHLAEMMERNSFAEWESVFAAVSGNEIVGFCKFSLVNVV